MHFSCQIKIIEYFYFENFSNEINFQCALLFHINKFNWYANTSWFVISLKKFNESNCKWNKNHCKHFDKDGAMIRMRLAWHQTKITMIFCNNKVYGQSNTFPFWLPGLNVSKL